MKNSDVKRSNKNREQVRDDVREKVINYYLDCHETLNNDEVVPHETVDAYGNVVWYLEPLLKKHENLCVIERMIGNAVWHCSVEKLPKVIRSFGGF